MDSLAELPKILFDPADPECDREERFRFWAALRPWFEQHGYHLYWHSHKESGSLSYLYPQAPSGGKDEFPFAHLGGDYSHRNAPPYAFWDIEHPNVHLAQDAKGRHLAIKLVKGDSDEYKINRFLSEQSPFPSGIIPILAMLPYDGHWFVVMPRWSRNITNPHFSTMAEILELMKCLLEGLAFLHAHRIFHRDISEFNLLVNHVYSDPSSFQYADQSHCRRQLRAVGHLTYGLFDFDLSLMLPTGKPLPAYSIPISEAFLGVPFKPWGVEEAQLDFNPFVYDVGCLGTFFCLYFQYYTSIIPMLAPLLDGMVTRNIKARFTAAEALAFLEKLHAEQNPDVLAHQPLEPSYIMDWRYYDRWAGLPQDFVDQWSAYRDPSTTYSFRLLQKVCGYEFGWRTVSMVRKMVQRVGRFLCQVQNILFKITCYCKKN